MRIRTLNQLIKARERRQAVCCGTGNFKGPIPAAFMANLSGEILHRLFTSYSGMTVYKPKRKPK